MIGLEDLDAVFDVLAILWGSNHPEKMSQSEGASDWLWEGVLQRVSQMLPRLRFKAEHNEPVSGRLWARVHYAFCER
jgi:hypothetical protein